MWNQWKSTSEFLRFWRNLLPPSSVRFLQNVGNHRSHYMVSHNIKFNSFSTATEPNIAKPYVWTSSWVSGIHTTFPPRTFQTFIFNTAVLLAIHQGSTSSEYLCKAATWFYIFSVNKYVLLYSAFQITRFHKGRCTLHL
jgi:hypothetical protein